ncbi:MAG: Maf family protein [Oscillospiraceae bacterium]|nr:Maf family protein [Oscillospiraceae bacterium]
MALILASASPRRRELLTMIGIGDFQVIADQSDEQTVEGLSPEQTVCEIALGKARNVSLLCGEDDIIIAADTLVFINDKVLGKPSSEAEAAKMLRELSGCRHRVYTGVALLQGGRESTFSEMTDVFFREISDDEINAYIETGEPMDKAGAYGAQGGGAVFIQRIEGDFFNVMGLPLCRLSIMLKDFGV